MLSPIRCPKCKNHKALRIQATVWLLAYRNIPGELMGFTQQDSTPTYDQQSPTKCPSCGHQAPLKEVQT
jgi:ribosomal protein L37AE/L43A